MRETDHLGTDLGNEIPQPGESWLNRNRGLLIWAGVVPVSLAVLWVARKRLTKTE
jgi:hypothetical protein